MQQRRYTVRVMTRQEVDTALDWAAAEGWNPGLHDADCFRATDPTGFLVGLLGDEPVATVPFDEVCAYDRPLFPADRRRFLQGWVAMPQSAALGVLQGGRLAGYGVLRACRTGHKIGPLFADSPELADRLFVALSAQAPAGAPVFLDVPAVNAAAVALAERHRLTVAFETARMYRGTTPDLPLHRLFGVTTFELG